MLLAQVASSKSLNRYATHSASVGNWIYRSFVQSWGLLLMLAEDRAQPTGLQAGAFPGGVDGRSIPVSHNR